MNNWEQMYQEGDTHWDKGEASPCLLEWLEKGTDLQGRVLVPGCGFGHDVRAWAEAGFSVTGMDISPTAINGAKAFPDNMDKDVTFVLEDFFQPVGIIEPFDIVFEHTFFCAINPDQRDAYVEQLLKWLKPGGHFLAIHYFLPKDEEGPPFGTDRDEIRSRFSPYLTLIDDWVPNSWEHRQGLERMFLWKREDTK